MPVPVYLKFLPPDRAGFTKLHIYEAPDLTSALTEIEDTTDIGTYPNYIDRYTTTLAESATDFFAIQWEDENGVLTDMSARIQGGTETLASILTERVLLRDGSLNETIVTQEAEAVISFFYSITDPSTVDASTVSPLVLSGLTMLTLARVYMTRLVSQSQTNRWSAGIVSVETSTSAQSWQSIDNLITQANRFLGRNYSTILLLKEIQVAGGYEKLISWDVSRSLIEVE